MLYVKVKGGDYYLIICRTDFYWARAMGFAGQQLDDGDGVSVGKQQHYCVNIYKSQFHSTQAQPLNQLLSTSTWMGGAGTTSLLVRVTSIISYYKHHHHSVHFADEGHGTGPSHPGAQQGLREMILGA